MSDFNTGLTSNNLAMIGYTGQSKVDPALAEAILNRKKEQTTNPAPKIQKPEADSFVSSLTQATSNNNGKFDIDQAAINFGKGLISPITQMFSSPKNFAIGAGMMAGAAALTIATGGAILPVIVAIGLGTGTVQACTGLYKFATAKNGDEREKAFFDAGAATSTIAGSIAGAKPALNTYNASAGAGIKVSNNSFIAAGQCIMNAKGSAAASINIAKTSGLTNLSTPLAALKTIGDASKGKSKPAEANKVKPETTQRASTDKPEITPEVKTKAAPQANVEPVEVKVQKNTQAVTTAPDKKPTTTSPVTETPTQTNATNTTKTTPKLKETSTASSKPTSRQAEVIAKWKEEAAEIKTFDDAYDKWQGGGYASNINGYRRNGSNTAWHEHLGSKIETLLDQNISEAADDIILYRGVENSSKMAGMPTKTNFDVTSLKVGDVIDDAGYSATSTSENLAKQFSGDLMMKIKVSKGQPIIDARKHLGYKDGEVILPRNSKLKITKIENGIAECEYVPSSSGKAGNSNINVQASATQAKTNPAIKYQSTNEKPYSINGGQTDRFKIKTLNGEREVAISETKGGIVSKYKAYDPDTGEFICDLDIQREDYGSFRFSKFQDVALEKLRIAQAKEASIQKAITARAKAKEILADPAKKAEIDAILRESKIEVSNSENGKVLTGSVDDILRSAIDEYKGESIRDIYHATSQENASNIVANGFDGSRTLRGEVGQGAYFGIKPDGLKEAYGPNVIKAEYTGDKIAQVSPGVIKAVKDSSIRYDLLDRLGLDVNSGEIAYAILDNYILDTYKSLGYDAAISASQNAGCKFLAVFNPQKITNIGLL